MEVTDSKHCKKCPPLRHCLIRLDLPEKRIVYQALVGTTYNAWSEILPILLSCNGPLKFLSSLLLTLTNSLFYLFTCSRSSFVEQLFIMSILADFSHRHWNAESATLVIIQQYSPLETKMSKTFNHQERKQESRQSQHYLPSITNEDWQAFREPCLRTLNAHKKIQGNS